MAKRLPTFLGIALKEEHDDYNGKPLYSDDRVHVVWSSTQNRWEAVCRLGGLRGCTCFGTTAQKALDKCEAAAIDTFRTIGAQLGYEVE